MFVDENVEVGCPKPWMIFGLRIDQEKMRKPPGLRTDQPGERKPPGLRTNQQQGERKPPEPEEINAVRRRRTSLDRPAPDSGSQVHACPPDHGPQEIRAGRHIYH